MAAVLIIECAPVGSTQAKTLQYITSSGNCSESFHAKTLLWRGTLEKGRNAKTSCPKSRILDTLCVWPQSMAW
jgi:hypothetical protein